ncbi:MAG: hypothetical protein A2268_07685 [Candidatus Raymondbacteria bacterium RifOxyA12_full_50_37]|uniref:histidine kinase n=1 Tax=Candidatus Raymondbacteria bacterium RIFOXYD12_FULL_49_13 TaxID=1817890 RepID=A0A1F7F4Z4_UNCRA|nr:MAG: hypothetical protein A2248_05295 [Candidatus Raymondbacteria bacterium RIFOXYA2_FULL_49_16]OGJ90123.1 MAG: hypothetical protein A2268_07685 [Candidatus Raymondbacteria bacterium RifOxyA12_full_50_37]OGJ92130.1 MAG: hypothetical protein A2350_08665 [Candidatus Raymondbacteria bacterium RifOxyB12_full_50_8]OGJ97701.1 MAG: hypothetical protein A2453_09655 [Candidatus Raymondbacteria bacterium RIFOXYC2_FULL_50_21]OGK01734.1 MAG: hypothetical protein A2519_22960 [Candidatus Raymondbacteria b
MKEKKNNPKNAREASGYTDAIALLSVIQNITHQLFAVENIADINKLIASEFKDIDQFNATVLLLNREKTRLEIAATTGRHTRLMASMKKTLGISLEGTFVNLDKAAAFNQVVKTGRPFHMPVKESLAQFLPGPVMQFIEKVTPGSHDRRTILSPIKINSETVGVFSLSCPPEVSIFMPLVENFTMHLSITLEKIREKKRRQDVEEEQNHTIALLKSINDLALELTTLPSATDLHGFICSWLSRTTKAKLSVVDEYDPVEKSIRISRLEAAPAVEGRIRNVVQASLGELSWPLSDTVYSHLVRERAIVAPSLRELLFNAVPQETCDALEAAIGPGDRYGVVFHHNDKLFGTAAIFLEEGASPISEDILVIFSTMVSAAFQRQANEIELQMSEQKYRKIFESLRDIYYKVDPEGRVMAISPSIAHAGYTPNEVIGRNFSEFYARSQDRSQFLQTIYAKGEVFDYEIRFRAKNGSLLSLSVDAHVIFSDDGRPAAIEGMLHDITQRKQIEEALIRSRQELEIRVAERTEDLYQANEQLKIELGRRKRTEEVLRESEAKFRRLVQQSKDAIFLVSRDGEVIYASPACEAIFGHAAEEFLADNDLADRLVHPDHQAAYAKTWEIFRQSQVYPETPIKVPFIHKDGHLVYTENNITSILDDTGVLVGIQIIIRDITQRTLAEAELKASEEQFRNLAEQSPNMIFINNMGLLAYVNQQCVDIMGYTREEYYSDEFDFLNLIASEFQDITRERFGMQMQGANVPPCEYVIVTKSGKRINALLSSRVIAYGKGKAVLGVVTDISARKKTEQDLIRAKEMLERQNEELKKIDRIKDGLVRDVAHELKTPVAKQAMQIELLKETCEQCQNREKGENIVKVMEEAVRRQEKVIRNILDLSRLEAGGRKYRIAPVRLDHVVSEVLMYYDGIIKKYNGAVSVTLVETTVQSDAEMLFHVFSNVVNNAVKYRERTRPLKMTVSMEIAAGKAVVKIGDNGVGLEGDERLLAFESFYQASPSSEGSGVGLSICKRIIEDLKGAIRLESDGKGKGTTAVVELPVESS